LLSFCGCGLVMPLVGDAVVDCQRMCRGTSGGVAVELYDESRACVEDACTLSCDE
jgi:hypothetical protein